MLETGVKEVTPLEITPLEANQKSLEGQGVEQPVGELQTHSPQAIEECSTSRSTFGSTLELSSEEKLMGNVELMREHS